MQLTKNYRKELISRVDKYCKRTGKRRSSVGRSIINNARIFDVIENGGGCTVDTYIRIVEWLDKHCKKA